MISAASAFDALPSGFGSVPATARVRSEPEDFQVVEQLGFAADGDGPHWLLTIEKRCWSTEALAGHLARLAGCRPRDIGYAGRKDHFAVTTQHFTVPDEQQRLDWSTLTLDGRARLLDARRHRRKLRVGALEGNVFQLRLRDVEGDKEALEARFETLAEQGFANYFGDQRFGPEARNVVQGLTLLAKPPRRKRHAQQGMLYSAVRSYLFNQVLARRISVGSWRQPLTGEPVLLTGGNSFFMAGAADPSLDSRLRDGDISTSGPLPGADSPAQGVCQALEDDVLQPYAAVVSQLAQHGLKHQRRALIARMSDAALDWSGNDAILRFGLPAGAFATSLLKALVAAPASC